MNSKIKIIEKQVIKHIYKTTDGEEFDSYWQASLHQDKLDGKKKTCPRCDGTGSIINPDYTLYQYQSGRYSRAPKQKITCTKCDGRGYLELKFA